MKKIMGGAGYLMIGMVMSVSLVSTLTAKQFKLESIKRENTYLNDKKNHIDEYNNAIKASFISQSDHSSSDINAEIVDHAIYTNIFNSSEIRTNINSVGNAGSKYTTLSVDENNYNKNNLSTATSSNVKSLAIDNRATSLFSEEAARDDQILKSYENMKKLAQKMYMDVLQSSAIEWPSSIPSGYNDAWQRSFSYNKISESKAQLSFNLPWDTSTRKILDLRLPEIPFEIPYYTDILSRNYGYIAKDNTGKYWSSGYFDSENHLQASKISFYDTEAYVDRTTDLAVINGGELWGQGFNSYYQLGTGNTSKLNTLTDLGLRNVTAVAAASRHSAAISGGVLRVAGEGSKGEIGIGFTDAKTWKYAVSYYDGAQHTISDYIDVAVKYSNTYALRSDGTVWATGSTSYSAIPNYTGTGSYIGFLKQTDGMTNAVEIQASAGEIFALKSDGTLWGAGHNSYGTLGLGHNSEVSNWTQLLTDVKEFSTRQRHIIAVKNNGDVIVAGDNYCGQLGLGTDSDSYNSWQTITINNPDKVIAGDCFSFILKDGEIWGAGYNEDSELSIGHLENVNVWTRSWFYEEEVALQDSITYIDPNPYEIIIDVPSGVNIITVTTDYNSAGTTDGDTQILVNSGTTVNVSNYLCYVDYSGADEVCALPVSADKYAIQILPYNTAEGYTNVDFKVTYYRPMSR